MSNIIKSHRIQYKEGDSSPFLDEESTKKKDEESFQLEETQIEAKKILDEADKKAKEIILEAEYKASRKEEEMDQKMLILEAQTRQKAYDEGYEDGVAKGYEEGYSTGYNQGESEAEDIIKKALDIKEGYIKEREEQLEKLEPEIVELVIDIYEKVLGRKIDEDEDYIVDLAVSGIRRLDPTENLTVIVSKEDYPVVEENKDKLLVEASLIKELEIKYDINLNKGDCILETPKGNIDLGIQGQMDEVNDTLRKILSEA